MLSASLARPTRRERRTLACDATCRHVLLQLLNDENDADPREVAVFRPENWPWVRKTTRMEHSPGQSKAYMAFIPPVPCHAGFRTGLLGLAVTPLAPREEVESAPGAFRFAGL